MANTVYGAPLSPFVRKVRITLAEKQLDHHLEVVLPYAPPEGYEKLNPLKRIPAFQDDEVTLADSAVICHYLDNRHPEHPLLPNDPALRARCEWLEKYADYELFAIATDILFRETLIKPLLKKPTDTDKCAQAFTEALPPLLNYLEEQLGQNDWFVGNQYSLADIAIACQLINMNHAGYDVDADQWPGLANFMQRCLAREAVSQPVAEERKQVDKIRSMI